MTTPMIKNLAALCDHFGADKPSDLPRRIYNGTGCGASISLYLTRGKPLHSGGDPRWQNLTREREIRGFSIQTIVEGSEAEVNSPEFKLPVSVAVVDAWMKDMEAEASRLWAAANEEPGGVLAEADAARAPRHLQGALLRRRLQRRGLPDGAGPRHARGVHSAGDGGAAHLLRGARAQAAHAPRARPPGGPVRKLGTEEIEAGSAAFQARARRHLEARVREKAWARKAGEQFLREALLRSFKVDVQETKTGLRVRGEELHFDVVVIPVRKT